MKQNLINFHNSEVDRYIYRVMPVHRLFEIFHDNEIVLVNPIKWDDPFENLVLKDMIEGVFDNNPGAKVISKIFRTDIFGQCWTFHKETDAMWRIYSPDKQGVKVRCKVRNLLSSILDNNIDFEKGGLFLGKVDYVPQKNLISLLKCTPDIYGADIAKTLLLKRREFKHEAEVRIISTKGSGDIKKLKIEPLKIFDEIIFDPRMNKHIYESYKKHIIASGYKKRVRQSLLYQLPKELKRKTGDGARFFPV